MGRIYYIAIGKFEAFNVIAQAQILAFHQDLVACPVLNDEVTVCTALERYIGLRNAFREPDNVRAGRIGYTDRNHSQIFNGVYAISGREEIGIRTIITVKNVVADAPDDDIVTAVTTDLVVPTAPIELIYPITAG